MRLKQFTCIFPCKELREKCIFHCTHGAQCVLQCRASDILNKRLQLFSTKTIFRKKYSHLTYYLPNHNGAEAFHWPDVSSTGSAIYWMCALLDVSSTGCLIHRMLHLPDASSTGCFIHRMVHPPDASST